jgi:REP element-mobilizing transposase RayT
MLRTRGYLPHLEVPESTYFLTFRLAGTLPQNVLSGFLEKREHMRKYPPHKNQTLNDAEIQRLKYLESTKVQEYLDKGIGECWLRDTPIATIVKNSIEHFDSVKYVSHAWRIMPNHVHWLFTPIKTDKNGKLDSLLIEIIQGVQSFTAHQANKQLKRTGAFWNREYYDHLIRSSEEFGRLITYTIQNPVKAGLCKNWQDWPWTGVSKALKSLLLNDIPAGEDAGVTNP